MQNGKSRARHLLCEFCFERFRGHSAASTYIQAMQRARAAGGTKDAFPSDQQASAPSAPSIDFSAGQSGPRRAVWGIYPRFWRPLIVLTAGFLLLFFIQEGLNPVIRFHYFGARLTYAFSAKTTLTYVFGSTTTAGRWSERGGQMDTPLGDLKIADVSTVKILGTPEKHPKTTPVSLSSTNWLLEIYRKKGLESHLLSRQRNPLPLHASFLGGYPRRHHAPSTEALPFTHGQKSSPFSRVDVSGTAPPGNHALVGQGAMDG